ncbi:MAG: crossover junction endodeoxyribonuclease RuvC [Thermodesulfobacteriota bacterium]
MRVLGIDPGTRITGYGVVEKNGSNLIHICDGRILCTPKKSLKDRLKLIFDSLREIIDTYRPMIMAIEEGFMAKGIITSAIRLGQARGVAILSAAYMSIDVVEYSPSEVKQAVTGYGRADKTQVQKMVKRILSLSYLPEQDASDALAVSICHLHSMKMKSYSGR